MKTSDTGARTVIISIHAPSRERHKQIQTGNFYNKISIHAPSRERHSIVSPPIIIEYISIHAPSRERHGGRGLSGKKLPISIHAPSRERHLLQNLCKVANQFQSTLPRGSDMEISAIVEVGENISIHAPSRERQLEGLFSIVLLAISIHAPSRERHEDLYRFIDEAAEFQSTLPRGSDNGMESGTKGFSGFQSTLPRGSDKQDFRPG